MTRIKVFRFKVSNAALHPHGSDRNDTTFMSKVNELYTPDKIEKVINDFIKYEVDTLVDLKVNTVDEQYHNNGRGNTVSLVYTLTYIKLGG